MFPHEIPAAGLFVVKFDDFPNCFHRGGIAHRTGKTSLASLNILPTKSNSKALATAVNQSFMVINRKGAGKATGKG